ncbi:2-amino-4-hydroxy-6-hydroxymethyldihydropteridine diphosphokinase [Clostridium tyrobutyricum]|jgi:dihydroneopterin aldolase/2-amino-4-hydroxy-6-hydroxymethyldihydropteridine diphosphokinase|uniref:2-amino-4-hydroxy-6- hydroxymethyldihydropteridine diphosphokinase n=1 Tax=Clostridium tyrobutyricum TaxID=1519 RepID=UPI0010AAD5ED|nr:2-amino-4-hydroxy-6-hydroxymethyldihydropteridine diphosphokinase [Clostridium tyrobutyricum]MBR9647539.1 2-amino-4-hydroxy-6-hydroxymethyldihydropteridine diphosphokinase [Clostridium tyrobutyricum]MBV4417019.1 2-amino-4-hydroxy-6-hydroxymethyldihydropteridine diphosphokinase [Clostridium tyrobutyricum]MBV4422457.1 2-amino-4-hydroxy-6-hydroxymethyldihydropteridine diphosphokinase [Clostridium tyrobutyricum]MBV4425871.1 2-amino-4-hydroxy-6-hydroxymethyldihydropteridine diphosphokinase [Clost
MDSILINNLEIYAFHGVNQQEKELGQKFLLSAKIFIDIKEASQNDDLSKTVNYAKLCIDIENEFKKCKYNLIETAGDKLAEFIILKYDFIKGIRLTIKKPWAPIGRPVSYVAVEINKLWHNVYVSLGSNMGNKQENISKSITMIDNSKYCKVIDISSNYETKPVGYLDQDNFLNCAIYVRTILTPEQLIKFFMNIEKILKRKRIIKWGPRTIDLDILLYDNIISDSREITIPHPRMHERMFVLKPLSEIAPYVLHPILKKRIFEIENELSKKQKLI